MISQTYYHSPELKPIDLTQEQLTPEDFEGNLVLAETSQSPVINILRIVAHPLPPSSPLKSSKVTKGATVPEMAKALDGIAAEAIRNTLSPKTKARGTSLAARITDITERRSQLATLKGNLQIHDWIISEYNKKLGRPCPNHDKIEKEIDQAIELLKKREDKLTKTLHTSKIEKELRHLKLAIGHGLAIDREYILHQTPLFKKKLESLPAETAKKYEAQYSEMVNQAYISHLMSSLSRNNLPLPDSLKVTLTSLGYSEAELSDSLLSSKSQLRAQFKAHLKNPEILKMSPSDLAHLTQTHIIESISANERVSTVLKMALNYERTLESQLTQEDLTETLKTMDQRYADKWSKAKSSSVIKEMIPAVISEQLRSVLGYVRGGKKKYGIGLKDMPQSDFERMMQKTQDLIQSESVDDGAIRARLFHAWTQTQSKDGHILFEWGQDDAGGAAVLETGLCRTINLRWLLKSMENPTLVPTEPSDMDRVWETSVPGSKFSGETDQHVSPGDRFVHATYAVGFQKGETSMPRSLLNKLHLQMNEISSNQSSVDDVLERVLEADREGTVNLSDSEGLLELGVGKKEGAGHALGVRIDRKRNRYGYFDINAGYYEYPSFEAMKAAFKIHLDLYYSGDQRWTKFSATQFTRKP